MDLDQIRRKIFSFPMMSKHRISRYFSTIDDLLDAAIAMIDQHTSWLNQALISVLGKVAGYNTCKYYVMRRSNTKRVDLKNTNIINNKDISTIFDPLMEEFVTTSMVRMADMAFGTNRANGLPLHMIRGFKHEVVNTFMQNVHGYEDARLHMARLRERIDHTFNRDMLSSLLKQQHDVQQQILKIEEKIGTTNNIFLFGIVRMVSINLRRIKLLQNRVVRSYMKKAWTVAQEFSGKSDRWILRYFQSGALGLTKACMYYYFDVNQNFGSYAECWIRQEILSDIKRNNLIAETAGTLSKRAKISRTIRKHEQQGHGTLTKEQIAKRTDIPLAQIAPLMQQTENVRPIPLETPVGDGNTTLIDILIDVDTTDTRTLYSEGILSSVYRVDPYIGKVFAMAHGCEGLHTLQQPDLFDLIVTQAAANRSHNISFASLPTHINLPKKAFAEAISV